MSASASAYGATELARPAAFVTPPLDGPPTGGTLFDAHLLDALRAAGAPVRRISLAEAQSSAAGHDDLWVDSLYLDVVPELERRAPGRVHLCLHYLPSLVTHGTAWVPPLLAEGERAAIRAARSILVPSAWFGRLIDETGAGSGPSFVVEPGVAIGVNPRPPSSPQGPLQAVMVANVVSGKGILPFLLALERALPDPLPDSRDAAPLALTIAGSLDAAPSYAASCREACKKRPRLARTVRLAGSLPPDEARAAIAGADVLVSSSRMESYGMTLAEARALGVPILALRGGNAEAHVSERAGGAAFDDDAALAGELVQLSTRRAEAAARKRRAWDARRARSWAEAARDFVEKASIRA